LLDHGASASQSGGKCHQKGSDASVSGTLKNIHCLQLRVI
jgi:hypothetical protein